MVTVSVAELKKMVEELEKDEIEYVEIDEYEEHEFEGEIMPKSLHFLGCDGYGGGVDFEAIDDIEVSAFYKAEREYELEQLKKYYSKFKK